MTNPPTPAASPSFRTAASAGLRLLAAAVFVAFGACADVDSPWKVAPRGDDAWSISWLIAAILVAGTLAAGVFRLRTQLARKRHLATRPTEPLPPLPRGPVIVLIASVVIFVAPILLMVGIFMERPLTLVETAIFLGLMGLGALGLRWSGRRLTTANDAPGGQR